MEIKYFLPEFYAFEHNDRHDELKDILLPEIESRTPREFWNLSKCNTSFKGGENQFLRHPIIEELVWKCMDEILNHPLVNNSVDSYGYKSSVLQDIWYNTYDSGHYQEIHNHNGPAKSFRNKLYYNSFSFIYLLHNESETGTVFRSRNVSHAVTTNPESCAYKHLSEGSLLMFPYYMDHYVLPATGKRVTLAGNIASTFE